VLVERGHLRLQAGGQFFDFDSRRLHRSRGGSSHTEARATTGNSQSDAERFAAKQPRSESRSGQSASGGTNVIRPPSSHERSGSIPALPHARRAYDPNTNCWKRVFIFYFQILNRYWTVSVPYLQDQIGPIYSATRGGSIPRRSARVSAQQDNGLRNRLDGAARI
jgi:hypothetical protein